MATDPTPLIESETPQRLPLRSGIMKMSFSIAQACSLPGHNKFEIKLFKEYGLSYGSPAPIAYDGSGI